MIKKTVQSFQSYEEANDAQITLLASGIDCTVRHHSQDIWEISEGKNPAYGIEVEAAHVQKAKDLLKHHIAEDYESLIQCPGCQSTNGRRYSYYDSIWFMFTWIFIIPIFWSMYVMKKEGRRYKCLDCQRLYRIKL